MTRNSTQKLKHKKNLVMLGMIVAWVALIFIITIIKVKYSE